MGITTTVPVEAIIAAGLDCVDLNNIFIGRDPDDCLAIAEDRGFPMNLCAWIKGLYGAAKREDIGRIIGVVRGDCSSTEKLLEVWRHDGIETIPFAYPAEPNPVAMQAELESLARALGTTMDAAEEVRQSLLPLRRQLERLDRLTFEDGKVTGQENHLWLVSASDFNGGRDRYEKELGRFLARAERREPRRARIRLGYVGVPPIASDLYGFLASRGAEVVFNEVQRQFAMPGEHAGLAEQYSAYTYPYDTFGRAGDIGREVARRELDGVIHYAQTFCHRRIEGLFLSDLLDVPVIDIEADHPGPLEARTRTRLEAFIESLV